MVRALPILGPEQNSRTTGDQHEGAVPGSQSGASAEQAAAAHGGPGCAAACCQNGGGARVGRFTGFMLPAPPPSPAASSRNTAARPLQLSGATETTRGSELALLARRGAATGPTAPPTKRSNSGMLPLGGAAPVPPTVDGGPDAAAAADTSVGTAASPSSCPGCHVSLISGAALSRTAGGKLWHIACLAGRCAGCGSRINSAHREVVTLEGLQFCSESCLLCAGCNRPLTTWFCCFGSAAYQTSKDGALWHPGCHAKRAEMRCGVCGTGVSGQYIEADDGSLMKFHPGCHAERVEMRCGVCGTGITGQYIEADDGSLMTFHPRCHAKRVEKLCGVCGTGITGQYIKADDGSNVKFHPRCHAKRVEELCGVCGAGITGQYIKADDGSNMKYHRECYDKKFNTCVCCGVVCGGGVAMNLDPPNFDV